MRLSRTGCAAILLLLSTAPRAIAQETMERVAFPDYGFSATLPAGWVPIPDSVIQARKETMPQPPGVRDIAGFRPLTAPDWFAPPYLMVKVQETGPMDVTELERLALDPNRRVALAQWLDLLERAYGIDYDPQLFSWNRSDRIMWVTASGSSDPFPDVISIAGAVVSPRGYILVAYRVFPSMDLEKARNTVRDVLLSVQVDD